MFKWLQNYGNRQKAINKAYKKLCERMDATDRFRQLLKEYFLKNGRIPPEYRIEWRECLREPRPWRKVPGTRFSIWLAAVKMADNELKIENKKGGRN